MKKCIPILLFICALLASCGTANKLTLAQRCAKEYPCRDTAVVVVREYADTLLLQPDVVVDSVTVPCPPGLTDTLRTTVVVTITPPAKLVPVKFTIRDTIDARIDSALRVAYKELELRNGEITRQMLTYEAERNEARKSARRGWWSWILVGLLGAALVYVLIKKKS